MKPKIIVFYLSTFKYYFKFYLKRQLPQYLLLVTRTALIAKGESNSDVEACLKEG